MKSVFLATSLALSMTAFAALAADQHGVHGDGPKAEANTGAAHAGHGKINSVNLESGTVNLTHDPIESLKWPKMTMDFRARDPAILKDLKPGTQVDFELMKMGDGYHIMKISPSAN